MPGQAPTGSEAQWGYRFSKGVTAHGEDIWQGPVNKFARFMSMEGMEEQYVFTPVDNMDPSNQSLGGDPTQASVAPKIKLNPDVDTIVPLLVHHCGKEAVITTPAGGVDARQWVITPWEAGDDPNTEYIDSLIMEGYDGQECSLVDGARMQDLGLKIDQGKNAIADLGFLAAGITRESDATEVLVDSYTGVPILTGQRAAAIEGQTLKMRVTAGAGGGYDGTAKWSVGAFAGTTTIPFVFNRRYRVVLDTGALGGVSREQDLWFLVPSTDPATAVAIGDEWSFTDIRIPADPSYSEQRILKATGLSLLIAGEEYFVKSGEIKVTRPRKPNFVAQRMNALSVQRGGKWRAEITLDRQRDDTDFVKKLRRAETFAVQSALYGLPIEGNILGQWRTEVNAKVSSVQRGVPNDDTLTEKVTIMAERSGTTPIVTHTVVCSLAALNP